MVGLDSQLAGTFPVPLLQDATWSQGLLLSHSQSCATKYLSGPLQVELVSWNSGVNLTTTVFLLSGNKWKTSQRTCFHMAKCLKTPYILIFLVYYMSHEKLIRFLSDVQLRLHYKNLASSHIPIQKAEEEPRHFLKKWQ